MGARAEEGLAPGASELLRDRAEGAGQLKRHNLPALTWPC